MKKLKKNKRSCHKRRADDNDCLTLQMPNQSRVELLQHVERLPVLLAIKSDAAEMCGVVLLCAKFFFKKKFCDDGAIVNISEHTNIQCARIAQVPPDTYCT